MRQITCPVCKTDPIDIPDSQSICLCPSCNVRWTYLDEEVDAETLYSDEVYAVVDNRRSIFERIIFSESKKILQTARKLQPKAKFLLDFGSGKGQFLAVAKEAEWQGLGIETAAERAEFARKNYLVEVVGDFYEGGKIQNGNFDFITLNHVLEHLPDPIGFVRELLEQNLATNGLVYIEVPRADSWQAKLAGKNWMHWDIPKHLSHWTEAELANQFEKIGYAKIQTRSYSLHLGVLGMLQALLSAFGYRKNLIVQLKQKKSFDLMLLIVLVLPFAWLLELLACTFGKSGIFGIYLKKNG